MGQSNDSTKIEKLIIPEPANKQMEIKPETCFQKKPSYKDREKCIFKKQSQSPKSEKGNARREAVSNLVSGYLQELDERVKSMMEKSQNRTSNGKNYAFICNLCGKEGYHMNIRGHIEANHLEGVSLPCKLCGNIFSSRRQLRRHKCKDE